MENTITDQKPDISKVVIKTEVKEEYDPLAQIETANEQDDVKDEPSLIYLNEIKTETYLDADNDQKYDINTISAVKCEPRVEAFVFKPADEALNTELDIKKENEKNLKGKLCPYCNLLINPKKIKVHIMGHTGERPYKCTLCESAFKEKYNLSIHIKTHTGERNIPCTLCDKTFIVPSALKAHMRTHSKEKPYVCGICGKGFSHSANLKPHIATHSEELPFMCPDCGKHFRYRKGLVQHTKVHHVNCENANCEFCMKYFTKKNKPRVAQKQYEKLRECPVCLQVFKYYTTYKNHMRMHNNENFQCGFCEKTYIDRASLRCHLRRHTGEMPFQCEVCGKMFTRRDSYRFHLSTHNKDRQMFHCDICNQGFTHKSSVFKHKRQIHDLEKPFKCGFCPRCFQSQELLDSHILRLHGNTSIHDKTYIFCRFCDRNVNPKGYKAHMKKHGIDVFKCRKCKCSIEGEEAFNVHKRAKCSTVDCEETATNFELAATRGNVEEDAVQVEGTDGGNGIQRAETVGDEDNSDCNEVEEGGGETMEDEDSSDGNEVEEGKIMKYDNSGDGNEVEEGGGETMEDEDGSDGNEVEDKKTIKDDNSSDGNEFEEGKIVKGDDNSDGDEYEEEAEAMDMKGDGDEVEDDENSDGDEVENGEIIDDKEAEEEDKKILADADS